MIRKVLVIPTGTQVKVQSFDKEWDAWINVKPGSALQDRTRLKCVTIVSVMQSVSADNRMENTTSPQDLVLTSPCRRKLVRQRHQQNCCRKPRGGWAQLFRGLWRQDWSWTGSRGTSWYSYSQTSYTAEMTTNQLPSKVVWRGLDHGRNASSSRTLLGVHTDSLTSNRVKVIP